VPVVIGRGPGLSLRQAGASLALVLRCLHTGRVKCSGRQDTCRLSPGSKDASPQRSLTGYSSPGSPLHCQVPGIGSRRVAPCGNGAPTSLAPRPQQHHDPHVNVRPYPQRHPGQDPGSVRGRAAAGRGAPARAGGGRDGGELAGTGGLARDGLGELMVDRSHPPIVALGCRSPCRGPEPGTSQELRLGDRPRDGLLPVVPAEFRGDRLSGCRLLA
jgi:hypothetical protein